MVCNPAVSTCVLCILHARQGRGTAESEWAKYCYAAKDDFNPLVRIRLAGTPSQHVKYTHHFPLRLVCAVAMPLCATWLVILAAASPSSAMDARHQLSSCVGNSGRVSAKAARRLVLRVDFFSSAGWHGHKPLGLCTVGSVCHVL